MKQLLIYNSAEKPPLTPTPAPHRTKAKVADCGVAQDSDLKITKREIPGLSSIKARAHILLKLSIPLT